MRRTIWTTPGSGHSWLLLLPHIPNIKNKYQIWNPLIDINILIIYHICCPMNLNPCDISSHLICSYILAVKHSVTLLAWVANCVITRMSWTTTTTAITTSYQSVVTMTSYQSVVSNHYSIIAKCRNYYYIMLKCIN